MNSNPDSGPEYQSQASDPAAGPAPPYHIHGVGQHKGRTREGSILEMKEALRKVAHKLDARDGVNPRRRFWRMGHE